MLVEHMIAHRPAELATHFRAVGNGIVVLAEVANAIKATVLEVEIDGERRWREVVDFVAGSVVGTGCEVAHTIHLEDVVVARKATDDRIGVPVENRDRRFGGWCHRLQIGADWRCE